MPEVPPDPLYVSFTIRYDNTIGTAPGEVLLGPGEIFSNDGGPELVTTFDVTPAAVTVQPGEVFEVEHTKVDGSGEGSSGCEYCGATDVILSVATDVDGDSFFLGTAGLSFVCGL